MREPVDIEVDPWKDLGYEDAGAMERLPSQVSRSRAAGVSLHSRTPLPAPLAAAAPTPILPYQLRYRDLIRYIYYDIVAVNESCVWLLDT